MFQTLFVVTGSCQGLEISLDVDSVTFGAVVQNSSSTRQFIMNNTGDIGARSILSLLRSEVYNCALLILVHHICIVIVSLQSAYQDMPHLLS